MSDHFGMLCIKGLKKAPLLIFTCPNLMRQQRRSGIFIVYFEHILLIVLAYIVNFEHVIAGWHF